MITACKCGAHKLLTVTGVRYEENAGAICLHRADSCSWFDSRTRLAESEENFTNAAALCAGMHAAAVGEVRGPNMGVVEDVKEIRRRMLAAEAERDALKGEVERLNRDYTYHCEQIRAQRTLLAAAEADLSSLRARCEAAGARLRSERDGAMTLADNNAAIAEELQAERDDLLGALRAVLASVTCEDDGGFCSVCGKCHDEAAPGCWANRARAAIAKVSSKGDDK